ncbi:unnamed protein product [Rotaria sp. Silwood2]|nr:unnamed protein product [Rotaria sp. Silwood2]
MRDPQDAIITKISDNLKEFTCITFIPDLKRFQMDKFDDYLVSLFKRRVYDVAVSTGCKVTLNVKLKILGLNYGEKYINKSDLSKLHYGILMIMADQDQDGSHITSLVINFIHCKWPNLLKHDYIEVLITPILKVSKGNDVIPFYSMLEFEEW